MNISKDKNDQLFNTKKTNGISTDDLESAIKKLFNDMDYLFQKGKGYSLYNVSASSFIEILKILEEIITQNYSFIKVSDLVNPVIDNLSFNEPLIIYQDLNLMELLECVDTLVNKFIYPAWYNSCPIVFISRLDKRNYNAGDIKSSMIHTDYNQIINLLSLEQLDNLLDLVNSNILSSEMILTFDSDVLYTPIEKIFRDRLIERNISFKPQVKLGRFYVDFLLEIRNSKIIVECDGRDYHDKDKDKERDKELKREGYDIFRFSGSRIFTDCDSCIDISIMIQL